MLSITKTGIQLQELTPRAEDFGASGQKEQKLLDESIDEKQNGKSFLRRRTMKVEPSKTSAKKVTKRIDCWLDNTPKVTSSVASNRLIANEEMDEEEKNLYL